MPSTRRPPANALTTKPKRPRANRAKVPHPFKQKRAAGRPPIYEEEAHCSRATKLALLGLTDEEISHQFGIDITTFYDWQKRHVAFSHALDDGRTIADAKMAQSLYNRGMGMKLPAVKIFYDKDQGGPVYAPYVEHLPPDVGAAKLWLLNRRPKDWRERKELEVTGTIEHRLAAMTPAERRARLIELQAKAALVIDGEASEVEE